jgi:hypothetical protein
MFGINCPPYAGDRWSLADERQLVTLVNQGWPSNRVAHIMGRTQGAIDARLRRMLEQELRTPIGPAYSWTHLTVLVESCNWDQYFMNQQRRELFEKTAARVYQEAFEMKFWMVNGSDQAHVKHPTYEKAEREARRLAAANPGHQFYVLEAVAMAVTPMGVVVTKIDANDEENDRG